MISERQKNFPAFPENDYTDDGQLLGHIIIGSQMVKERIDTMTGFPKKLESELIHCILAHHGELEYGSPKKPGPDRGDGIKSCGQRGRENGDHDRDLKRCRGQHGLARLQPLHGDECPPDE